MRRNKRFLTLMLAACGTLVLLTCRNPLLSVGLGDKVDITPPGISLIDSDGVQNGAYVHGIITIKGKSIDDISVASVSWTFTDTKTGESSQPALAALDETRKNWSFQLNTAQPGTLFRDGEKSFVFTVTDGTGKTTETRMLLIFDNGAPVAMVNLPSSEIDPLNSTVRLSGEAYDQFGVQSVTVRLFNTSTGGSPLNGAGGVTADGTNTWNYSFDSKTTLTTGAGDFWFQVTVEDRAGNRSGHQYLYTEVFAANANKQFTVDKLALLESGAAASHDSMDASELPGLQKVRQKMTIDQNSDKPTFIISSPLPSDIVGFNSRVVGLVNDDDGVKSGVSDIKVHVWKADNTQDFGWGNAVPAGSGLSVRFSYALNMISTSGDYKVEVQATDIYGTSATSTPVIFTVDAGIPAVSLNAVARVYFNKHETLQLTGTAQSIGGQVNKVELAIGATKVLASLGSPNAENTTWTGSFSLAGITEAPTPNKTLVVAATDDHLGTPKVGSTNLFLIIDNTAPQARFVSPSNGATVYNQVTLRGTSSDNSSLTKVELRIGKAGTGSGDGFFEITGSLYDWTKDFLSNDYANPTQSTAQGDGTWGLPIYCRVYDVAGNVSTNEPSSGPLYPSALAALYGSALSFDPANIPAFALVIDLDRDKPTITIQTPRDGANVAGTVAASGSCFDESPGMDKVEIQIAALRDDDSLIGYVTPTGAAQGAPGWIVVPWIGGQRSYWQQSLNENEKLYNVGAAGGAYPGEGPHRGKLRVSVRPTDLGAKVGNAQTVTFRLDDTIPRLEAPKLKLNGVDVAAVDYLYARGTIRLKAKARDNQQVTSIKISMDGGSSYGSEQIDGSYVTPSPPSDYFDIDYPIDTLADSQIPAGIRGAKNGLLTLGVKVQDNATPAPYVNTWFVTLNMDNLYPTVSYTGTALNGHDPMLLSGNKVFSSQVMGTSTDSGSVSGIDKVEVYLIKGLDALNLSGGANASHAPATFGDPGVPAPYTTDPACKLVIDWTKVGAVDNMQLVQNGANVDWWAKLNTTVLPDGPVEIHFVAFDKAGNGTHGSQAGYIVNNAPVINSITLGTDVNGDGTIGNVASGESKVFSSGYAATGFTVRNGKLKITVAASSGNGTKRYSLKYAGTTEKNVSPFTSNSVTITDFTGMPDAAVNGSTFAVLVYDSTVSNDVDPTGELTATATIGMTFDNVDDAAPTISVAPFGKRYGSSSDDSAKSLATVGAYNENIVMNASVRAGHVEYQGQSLFDGTDADISGQVIFRGKAADNQRVKSVTVQIPGYDPPDPDGAGPLPDPGGAGAEFEVAAWSGGALVSNYSGTLNATNTWSLSVEAPFLTELYGHALNWAFSWNSASIANYAKADVTATFRIYDHASPSNSGSSAVTVDVVPYITAVKTTQTSNGGIKAGNIRSSLGKYSIKTGAIADFITIEGFNLNPITNGVRVSSATYKSGLNGTTLIGNALAANAPNADRTTVTVSNATAASGYLTVVSGTAGAPVPSGNNGNNNDSYVDLNGDATAQLAEQYNREPDELSVKNRLLTDDRYIDFFTVTDTGFTSSYFPNMLMSGDTPIWGYVQGGAANDLQVRRGTNSGSNIGLVRILSADQLTMARDDDAIYHMVSVNNFNLGRMVYLYNFFETTPGYGNGGATSPYWSGYTGVFASATGNNAIELDSVNYGSLSLGRYAGLQLVAKGSSNTPGQYSRVYLGYYDQSTGELLFRNFRVGRAAVGNNLYDLGRSNQADTTVTSGDAARKLVSSSASQYFAMGVTDQNRVVFVYYDQAAGRLKVTYSTAAIDLASPTDAVTFSSPVDIPADYVGWYVSLAIESDGNAGTPDPIHIAAYDTSDGDLRYVYMTSYADGSPQIVRVDANNSVGIYTSVKVRAGKPWISYYNNSENGTRDSIKLARYLGSMTTIANGAGADGFATGEWEYLTVPVTTPPQGGLTKFLKVNLDFNTSGDPILGYAASSIEHSRRLPEVTP